MADKIARSRSEAARINGRSGGRPVEGQVEWRTAIPNATDPERRIDRWWARVRFADDTRRWVELDPAIAHDDEAGAKRMAIEARDLVRAQGLVTARETLREYAKRWGAWREERRLGCVKDDLTRLDKHVFTFRELGERDVRRIARGDLEDLVEELDHRIRTGELGWKTAQHAFGTVRRLFKDATEAKRRDLRVRRDNPAANIARPERGPVKAKQYLYPSEFAALMQSARVPIRWKRLFALAVYSGVRKGELHALEWGDVDLDHGTLHIHRAIDRKRRGLKATKSETARRTPIEPNLRPLLQAMFIEAAGRGRVVALPSLGTLSNRLRFYLHRAGVARAELFVTDATRKQVTFHDLRATWISWSAIRGDDALRIMQRAGHSDFQTTQIYLREAENLCGAFGDVFPPLPPELLAVPRRSVEALGSGLPAWLASRLRDFPESVGWAERDSNPRPTD